MTCLYLAIEAYKVKNGLSSVILTDVCKFSKHSAICTYMCRSCFYGYSFNMIALKRIYWKILQKVICTLYSDYVGFFVLCDFLA